MLVTTLRMPDEALVIICSDASGAIEVQDLPKATGAASLSRATSIMQAANRTKVMHLLQQIKANPAKKVEFAFFHFCGFLGFLKINMN